MGDDFETVKAAARIQDFAAGFLQKSRGGAYCCPLCGSGTRGTASSDGALSVTSDGRHWECMSCGANGDVFDMAGLMYGLTDKKEQLKAVASWAGIDISGGYAPAQRKEPRNQPQPGPDYSEGRKHEAEYIERMRANIGRVEALSYLSARGFSQEDARAAGLGYDPVTRRIVIPWPGAGWYHVDRAISDTAVPKYMKPKSENVGKQPLYNPQASRSDAYFIVEGAFDALAVQLCGFEAVAVASNHISDSNLKELAQGVASEGGGVAIVLLDNDEHGMCGDMGGELAQALSDAGVCCVLGEYPAGAPKDVADWLKADRDGLRAFLGGEHARALVQAREAEEAAYLKSLSDRRVYDPAEVASGIYLLSGAVDPIPTGIGGLDAILDGGIRPGLYALGAVSSMGKTTLAVQIADNIAASGRGVLFVTIEQSAREIVAKSLSRLARTRNRGNNWNTITATEAVSPSRRALWNDQQAEAFKVACEAYTAEIAPSLRILEGTKQPTVDEIEAVACLMAKHDGRPPVLFIDYLQLLAPQDKHDSDKQAVDRNVMALRQLARDLSTPIVAISSLNRASYSTGVTMDSWKESGAIEYGCDVLLGLQPEGIQDKTDAAKDTDVKRLANKEMRQHKGSSIRPCELVVLKNRNGATPERGVPLTFLPLSSLYTEEEQPRATVRVL